MWHPIVNLLPPAILILFPLWVIFAALRTGKVRFKSSLAIKKKEQPVMFWSAIGFYATVAGATAYVFASALWQGSR